MSKPFAHFHSSAAPARAVTWEEAERATAAGVAAQDPLGISAQWAPRWKTYMETNYPQFAETHAMQSQWSCKLYYCRRFFGTQHIMADIIMEETDAECVYTLARLTDLELTHIRELIRMRRYQGDWVDRVMAEVRRRLTPEQREHARGDALIAQTNIGSVLHNRRLAPFMVHRITEFAGLNYIPAGHYLVPPVLQRARVQIDRLRWDRTGTLRTHARALILKLIETILPYPNEETWDRIFAYLTPQELHAMNQEVLYYVGDYDDEVEQDRWVPQWVRPDRLGNFAWRLRDQMGRLRSERANLAASGLIQWLARRDADAARHLSTYMTRTVDPSRTAAHTHITTQPGELVHAMMARVALRKRQAAAQASAEDPNAIARRTRRKRRDAAAAAAAMEDEEEKHGGD